MPTDTVILSLVFLVSGLVLGAVAEAARRGRLRRNNWVGIRTAAVMRSEAAWLSGHRAAAPWLFLAALGPVACGVALPFLPGGVVTVVALISVLWVLALLVFGAARASTEAQTHRPG